MLRVQLGRERAFIYDEGGIGYEYNEPGIGWCVDETPSKEIQRYATLLQAEHQKTVSRQQLDT